MEKKQDLRITRTHKLIKEAFFELMEEGGFEKISIQALADKAMVSRATFYLHFQDKYDLLDKIENEVLNDIKNIAKGVSIDDIVADISSGNPFKMILGMYNYVWENQSFFKLIMGENGDSSFFYKYYETISQTVPAIFDEGRLSIPKHYAVAFVIGIHTTMINEWLKTGLQETPQEMVEMITRVMRDVPKNIYDFEGFL